MHVSLYALLTVPAVIRSAAVLLAAIRAPKGDLLEIVRAIMRFRPKDDDHSGKGAPSLPGVKEDGDPGNPEP